MVSRSSHERRLPGRVCSASNVIPSAAPALEERSDEGKDSPLQFLRVVLESRPPMSNHDDQQRRLDSASRVRRSPAEQQEAARTRAFEAIEATFPSIDTATGDELVQMAVHALGFDAAGLAAALGIARSQGESLIRSPGSLSRRERSLLAQYLEMGVCEPKAFARNRSIAAGLRASIANADRKSADDQGPADAAR